MLVVHDLDTLTATERAAADVIIGIPRITADQIRTAAEKLGTGGLSSSDIAMPVTATPCALRLSMRPGQTAEAFVGRVTAFTAAVDRDRSPGRQMPVVPGLDGLFGMDAAAAWGRGLAKDMRAYVNGELDWSSVAPGCLLSGPPGCGKTVFAHRLAAECGVPIVVTSYSEWQSAGQQGHLGELMKCLRGRFAEARRLAPSILLVDEIDSV